MSDFLSGVLTTEFDTTAPSTLAFELDTTAGTGNWSATYFVDGIERASVADLGTVTLASVGISAFYNAADTDQFTSFELSVIPEPSSLALIGLALGALILLRRRA